MARRLLVVIAMTEISTSRLATVTGGRRAFGLSSLVDAMFLSERIPVGKRRPAPLPGENLLKIFGR